MRNFKKLFAVIMAVAMLASIMVPALAADSFKYEEEAKKLNSLGLFKGISETSFDPDLGTALTRETGLALMIRAMGKDAEVQAMTKEDIAAQLAKVVDKETINVNWAEPYVAYAVKNGLTDGIDTSILPNIKFGANLPLSGKEFIFFMLKAMGYTKTDVPWDDVLNYAAEIGMLTPAQAVSFGNNPEIIRDNAVGIIAGSMVATTASGVTLAQKLVDDGVIAVDAMAAAGYIAEPTATPTPTPVVFAVENVEALNLKQIIVVFNSEVDKTSAQNIANYSVSGQTIQNAALQEDNSSVILTLQGNLTNQTGKVNVTVKKELLDLNKVKLGKDFVQKDVSYTDVTLPSVAKVETIGAKKVKITFTEPVLTGATTVVNYKIDGKLFSASNITLDTTATSSVVEITLVNALAAGDHELSIVAGKIADISNLRNAPVTYTFNLVIVDTAPVATLVSATTSEIIIKYDQEIQALPSVKFGGTNLLEDWATSPSDKMTVKLTGITFPAAGGNLVIAKDVKNFFDVKSAEQILPFVPTVDSERPTISDITSEAAGELIIEFSEDLYSATDGTITVKDKDGNAVAYVTRAFVQANGQNVQNKIKITGNYTVAKSPYKVTISGYRDKSLNYMDTVTDFVVSVPDLVKPTISGTARVLNKIAITFSEAVEISGATNPDNYKYQQSGRSIYALPSSAGVEMGADGKTVTITFPDSWEAGGATYTAADITSIYVSGVYDLAATPNLMDDAVVTVGTETIATVKQADATAVGTVVIEFNSSGVVPTTVYAGDFEVYDADATTHTVLVTNAEISGRKLTLTLKTDGTYKLGTDGKIVGGGGAKVRVVADPQGTLTALGSSFAFNGADPTIADKIQPALKATSSSYAPVVTYSGNAMTIVAELTEGIAAGTFDGNDFVVVNGDNIIIPNDVVMASDINGAAAVGDITDKFVKVTIDDVTATATAIDFSKAIKVATKNVVATTDALANKFTVDTEGKAPKALTTAMTLQNATTILNDIKVVSASAASYDLNFRSAFTAADYLAAGEKIGLLTKLTSGATTTNKLVVLNANVAANTALLAGGLGAYDAADGDTISFKIIDLNGGFDSGWKNVTVDEFTAAQITLTLGANNVADKIAATATAGFNASATYTIKVHDVTAGGGGTGAKPNPDTVQVTTEADKSITAIQIGTSVAGVSDETVGNESTATLVITDANGTEYTVSLANAQVQ